MCYRKGEAIAGAERAGAGGARERRDSGGRRRVLADSSAQHRAAAAAPRRKMDSVRSGRYYCRLLLFRPFEHTTIRIELGNEGGYREY